jgi:hypothetical protein
LFKKTSEIHKKGNDQLGKIQSHIRNTSKGNNQLGKIQSHKLRNQHEIRNQIITSQLMKKKEIIWCDPGVHTNSPGVEKTRPCRVEQDGPRSNSK